MGMGWDQWGSSSAELGNSPSLDEQGPWQRHPHPCWLPQLLGTCPEQLLVLLEALSPGHGQQIPAVLTRRVSRRPRDESLHFVGPVRLVGRGKVLSWIKVGAKWKMHTEL